MCGFKKITKTQLNDFIKTKSSRKISSNSDLDSDWV